MTLARILAGLLTLAGAVPAVGFVVSLQRATGGRWRADFMGRHLMGTMASLATIYLVSTFGWVFMAITGKPLVATWFVLIYLAAFVWVDVMLWRRWWHLHHRHDLPAPAAGTSEDAHTP